MPLKTIVDCSTGTQTNVEMTPTEIVESEAAAARSIERHG